MWSGRDRERLGSVGHNSLSCNETVPAWVVGEGLLFTFSMGIWDLNFAAGGEVKEHSRYKCMALDGRRGCREFGASCPGGKVEPYHWFRGPGRGLSVL